MNNQEIKKNCLDLEYTGLAQKANAYLILLTTGILGFLGSFLWLQENDLFYIGSAFTIFILLIALILYNRASARMNTILEEVKKL